MDELEQVSNSPALEALINSFYDIPEVQGVALGVHGNFISLFRSEFGRYLSVNDILKDGRTPTLWPATYRAAGFTVTISSIYVVLYVTLSEIDFRSRYRLPATIGPGYALFVETITPYEGFADRTKHRPQIMGGISVSNAFASAAGTLGGFVQDAAQNNEYILSCSHVLSDSKGTDVIQQGSSDGGATPTETVATTSYDVPLLSGTGFLFTSPFNSVDAALALLNGSATPLPQIRTLGRVTSTLAKGQLGIGDDVVFVGKESDSQDCRIYRYIARLKVTIQGTVYNFGDVFEIESRLPIYVGSLSKDGDSGAWIVRDKVGQTDELCGLLFAGNTRGPNKNKAIGCFIDNVFSELSKKSRFTISLL